MGFTNIATATLTAAALFSSISNGLPSGLVSSVKRDSLKFDFGVEKIRGVNLGGWFVLEPWITPSIFEATPDVVVDEYTFCFGLGKEEASNRLMKHWSSWIIEDDFAEIAELGLNFVRIPIGYWAVSPLDGDPYVQGTYDYLSQALDWAEKYNLKVIIDLHGAPGSQNGFDNSGKRGPVGWTRNDTVAHTYTALNKIRDDHASHPAVASIELLNEPLGPALDYDNVEEFFTNGHANLVNSSVAVAFHDAFYGVNAWDNWAAGKSNLLLDTHHYEIFTISDLLASPSDHVSVACKFGDKMVKNNNTWTITGEWTGAITDCAKWLNGRGIGARFDGTYNPENGQAETIPIGSCDGLTTGTVEDLSEENRVNIQNFIEAQISAYEKADGWIFWTWKNEAAPEWHFQNLTKAGLVPQPFTKADGCASIPSSS